MKTTELLTVEIMDILTNNASNINDSLCEVLDTLTDENCNPLPTLNTELVLKLKDIAFNMYKLSESIEEGKLDIIGQNVK